MKYFFILILLITTWGCIDREPVKTGREGKGLPSFDLLLYDSTTYFNTNNIPAGEPVVLFYFSPQCPYCRAQMEEIIKDISTLKNIRFYVFTTWPFREMKDFYNHYQLYKYPNIMVGVNYTNFFIDYFKVQGVPYTAIYSKDKHLNNAFLGKIHVKQIKKIAEE